MTAEQKARLKQVVWVDPERMHGTPCFYGTRVPVQTLVNHLSGGIKLDEFIQDFPSVNREQAEAYIELAGELLLDSVPICVSS